MFNSQLKKVSISTRISSEIMNFSYKKDVLISRK